MRVVLPAWRLLSPRGGVGMTLWHLLDRYRTLAPDDEFVVLHDGTHVELPRAANVRAIPLHVPLLQNNLTWNELALPLAIARLRADLVHNLSYTLPWAVRRPSVVTVHDVSYKRHPEWFPRKAGAYLRLGTAQATRHATILVTDSQFSADEISELYHIDCERIRVVPLAADEAFRPLDDPGEIRRRFGLPRRFVFYLGGIHARRGVDTLLEACARVLPSREAHLVVAGPVTGDGYDLRAHAARLGLTDRVMMLGFVPEEDKPALYNAASAFAWPSLYEGFGLPPLEAMACGTPTVVANASSLPEVVGDAALLSEPGNAESLAHCLERLLDDADLAADLALRGPARAAQFSWERTARQMLAIYREATTGSVLRESGRA